MSNISRRAWLKWLALLSVAGTPVMLASTPVVAKVTKAAVHYPGQSQADADVPLVQVLHRIGR